MTDIANQKHRLLTRGSTHDRHDACDMLDALAKERDDLQAEIARLTAELEKSDGQYDTLVQEKRRLTTERDQALAQAASAATDMRKRAAATYAMYSGVDLTKRLLSLPIDPDAQKALDKLLARAREDAIRDAAHLIECDGDALGGKSGAAKAILALLNDGGRYE